MARSGRGLLSPRPGSVVAGFFASSNGATASTTVALLLLLLGEGVAAPVATGTGNADDLPAVEMTGAAGVAMAENDKGFATAVFEATGCEAATSGCAGEGNQPPETACQ